MDWPSAFVIAVLIVVVFCYLAWDNHLRAEVIKEAIRHGATDVKLD